MAADCLRLLSPKGFPVLLLANKKDLEHAREVTTEEGKSLAKEMDVHFAEVSAAEGFSEVGDAFRSVISDACANIAKLSNPNSSPTNTASRRKISVVSVSKIISAMFGRSGALVADHHNQKKRPSLSLWETASSGESSREDTRGCSGSSSPLPSTLDEGLEKEDDDPK